MTGLEKIIERIEAQGNETIEQISGASLKKTEEMLKKAQDDGKARYDDIIEKTHKKCAFHLETAKAQAATLSNKKILAKKVELLERTIARAKQELATLSNDEFCDLALQIAKNCHKEGDGEVCFNERCLKKLPADFEKKLNSSIKAGSLKVSDTPCDIPDGFIIKYGFIEENCTFEAIIEANEQNIKDEIAKILFA